MQVGAAVFDGPRADGEGQPSDGRGGNTTATGLPQRWTVLALNLTASVIGNSCRLADRRIAARASRKGLGERDDEAPSDCCDRVGDVPFGSDRQRLWVGNPREWQIPRAARRNVVLRGGWRLVRRSKSRRRQYRGWHGGGSRAIRVPHNHQARVPVSAPDNRARSAIATLSDRPDDRRRYLRAKWQTNTWSARFRLPATRSGATLQRATRSASCRDAPAALSAGQSARRADPRFPRAKRSFATPLAAGRGRVS